MLLRLAAAEKRAMARAYEDYIKTIASGTRCTTTCDSGKTHHIMRMTRPCSRAVGNIEADRHGLGPEIGSLRLTASFSLTPQASR
eukprot:jgi/Tetstr1/453515/TSEL_040483.t1